MLKLAIERKPYWIDLGRGLRVEVRPLTTVVIEAAQAFAAGQLASLKKESTTAGAAGGRLANLPDLGDPAVSRALGQLFFMQGLARYGIRAWAGFGENGKPYPVTPDYTDAFIRDEADLAALFYARYLAPYPEAFAEGEGSGSGRASTSPPGPTGAAAAPTTGRPAAGAKRTRTARAARSGKPNRARSKAGSPGI